MHGCDTVKRPPGPRYGGFGLPVGGLVEPAARLFPRLVWGWAVYGLDAVGSPGHLAAPWRRGTEEGRPEPPAGGSSAARGPWRAACGSLNCRPQVRRGYPLNLSISLSGGKETNRDSSSSCERTGKSPAPNSAAPQPLENVVFGRVRLSGRTEGEPKSILNGATARRGCQARTRPSPPPGGRLLRVGLLESAALSGW